MKIMKSLLIGAILFAHSALAAVNINTADAEKLRKN